MGDNCDKIYECEVKKPFLRNRVKTLEWVRTPVADALAAKASEIRCKDCHGAVRMHKKHVSHCPAPHVEHKRKEDSEYCPSGFYFKQSPGRKARLSLHPVK